MKHFVLILVLFSALIAKSQTEIRFSLGGNSSYTSVNKTSYTSDNYSSLKSWEIGIEVNHVMNSLVIGSGIGLISNSHERNFLSFADIEMSHKYKLLHLRFPVTAGYRFSLKNNFTIGLLAGATFNVAVGGTVREDAEHFYPTFYSTSNNRSIRYGNEERLLSGSDFAKTYCALQTGIKLGYEKINLNFLYNKGITNILPKSVSPQESQSLNSIAIVVQYKLFCLANKKLFKKEPLPTTERSF